MLKEIKSPTESEGHTLRCPGRASSQLRHAYAIKKACCNEILQHCRLDNSLLKLARKTIMQEQRLYETLLVEFCILVVECKQQWQLAVLSVRRMECDRIA